MAKTDYSELQRALWADPVVRERRKAGLSKAAKQRYESPEERELARQRHQAQMADPEKRARWAEAHLAARKRWAATRPESAWDKYPAEARVWDAMVQRCTNPASTSFKNYGGRGISVCPEWLTSGGGFAQFVADMGPRPSSKHSIDRVDNDGDYSPANCRWATRDEQMSHTQRTRLVTIDGVTLHHAEWARRIGISAPSLTYRLAQGFTGEALMKPGRRRRQL